MSNQQNTDMLARLQQMKINTRLTALQSAQTIMGTPGFLVEGGPAKVDHFTLLAMATDIEKYILGNIEEETNEFLNKPKPTIVPAKEMPSKLRP